MARTSNKVRYDKLKQRNEDVDKASKRLNNENAIRDCEADTGRSMGHDETSNTFQQAMIYTFDEMDQYHGDRLRDKGEGIEKKTKITNDDLREYQEELSEREQNLIENNGRKRFNDALDED